MSQASTESVGQQEETEVFNFFILSFYLRGGAVIDVISFSIPECVYDEGDNGEDILVRCFYEQHLDFGYTRDFEHINWRMVDAITLDEFPRAVPKKDIPDLTDAKEMAQERTAKAAREWRKAR